LETTAAVDLYAIPGSTFDKGTGNLCASCHQPREDFPVPEDGMVGGISEHWGPHHGPQSAMMLGVGGSTTGAPATHYSSDQLPDGCVSCHMGANKIHSFEPDTSVCTTCHGSNYDYEEATQDIRDALDALGDELVSCDLLTENSPDGHPTDRITAAGATIPEDEAAALWNWLYIAHEDKSMGVHNPGYTRTLLAESTFTCSK
jgi:hypothetical protein